MCISTVYKNEVTDDNILFRNVRAIRTEGNEVILTNIMEQELKVTGQIALADLISGKVVITE